MHIGIITPRYPPNSTGGGEVSVELLARSLSHRDEIRQVTVYTFDGDGPKQQNGVTIKRNKSPSTVLLEVINPYAYLKLKDELVRDQVDLLHSYNMHLHPVVGYLSNQLNLPSVASLNSYALIPNRDLSIPVGGPQEWYKRVVSASTGHILYERMRKINSFIAISSTVAEIYRDELLPNQNIDVIPNMYEPRFFDLNNYNRTLRKYTDNKYNILYVGSLRETKGVEYLIKSAKYLSQDYQITIAGGGKNRRSLEELTNNISVSDRVSLLGRVPHDSVMSLYSDADLFVHPGIWPEPFGRTILEAMQFGLPVIATNIGGPAEVIPQEMCLCEPKNPLDLARTINQVVTQKDEIGEQNRQYVRNTYSPETVLPDIINIYQNIVEH